VANTLSNQAPANALDLLVLVKQHLIDLQDHLRGDASNGLQEFWRDPVNGQQRQPRIENECRDRLLERLKPALAGQNVKLEPEAAHANNTRADLCATVTSGGVEKAVPIEIKLESHPEVWTAWHTQLDGKYATHPAAEGVGIYLVLWFGHKPKPHNRTKPTSAANFQQRLIKLIGPQDSMRLQVRLQVVVLDLSLPS
jgi:hypothetical protein